MVMFHEELTGMIQLLIHFIPFPVLPSDVLIDLFSTYINF